MPSRDAVVSAGERAQLIDDWVRQELLYQEALARQLDQQARLALLLEQTRRDLLVAALLDAEFASEELAFGEGDIHRYYDAHQDQFQRTQPEVKARHILLASHRDANARRQALQQGEDFAEVAREHSLDVDTRYRGGDLGYFSQADEPALWAASREMPLDNISKPIRTEYGYHLIQILERGEAGTIRNIDQVRTEIVEALVRERHKTRLDQLIAQLKDTADWAVTDPVSPTAHPAGADRPSPGDATAGM
ncbi:MAG: peptidylprolyl isomerase [Candidatus Latescibacterota bacterium]|nr:peptidylprolyl isomerase [Candidatus Latescibacterota bacterium]